VLKTAPVGPFFATQARLTQFVVEYNSGSAVAAF